MLSSPSVFLTGCHKTHAKNFHATQEKLYVGIMKFLKTASAAFLMSVLLGANQLSELGSRVLNFHKLVCVKNKDFIFVFIFK